MSGGIFRNKDERGGLRNAFSTLMRASSVGAMAAACLLLAPPADAQYRKIGEMELRLSGVSATVENAEPVVPKNTPGGIRILVRAGNVDLTLSDLARFLGPNFAVQGELTGPGFSQPVSLPALQPGEELPADPLILPTPPINIAGNYRLSNLRIVANGRTVLDVAPSSVPLKVIDQILVTQVTTRALTLEEIRGKGIVLDSDDYLGFEFTMGFKLDSKAIDLKFPVVFDRQGVAIPQPLSPPAAPSREGISLPTILPLLLEAETPSGERAELKFTTPSGVVKPITIPAVLVIPGNVGYLKQFFSAQLYVSNGAPVGSGLNVREIKATLKLPPGADLQLGTLDDPLALPQLERDGRVITQPLTADVRGVGPDGEPATGDDVDELAPAQQGQVEFLIRGEQEGFHQINFDLTAKLLGLPIGPVIVKGKAIGGVLVRNPFFNVTFTVPSVVRSGEHFKMRATVTNIGKGIGNDVSMTLDSSRMSGLTLLGDATKRIATLKPGDAKSLEFEFISQRTGKVVATYLKFDTQSGNSGKLNFTIGVGERNVPLSPDTLVLPASTDALPQPVVDAAMRVLGQAWSIANAPAGTLPQGVIRVDGQVVVKKALALAEAGLRVTLGQSSDAAVRDLLYDFFSGDPVDPGFDQLLRTTEAGYAFVQAAGGALSDSAMNVGGGPSYEFATARIVASAAPFASLGWDGVAGDLAVIDGAGRTSIRSTELDAPVVLTSQSVVGAVLMPLGSDMMLGLLTQPSAGPYRWEFRARESGTGSLSLTFERPDGSFGRATWSGSMVEGAVLRLVADASGGVTVQKDDNGDGVFEHTDTLSVNTLPADGPRLLAAAVIGPETLDGAGPWGFQTALVFDRVVGETSAANVSNYSIPNNSVRSAKRQLSGRLVFAALNSPEGPYVPTSLTLRGIEDTRGVAGQDLIVPLTSRLEQIGAVVSGRVLGSEGEPLSGRTVTYAQFPLLVCDTPTPPTGFAALVTDSTGTFELRYVRQDQCGNPFLLYTVDPSSGARRSQSLYVRDPGQQIVADFVMLAAGSVTGTVRNLSGQAVPGANVTVLSQTETQVGASTVTDALGKYTVSGITVGPVVVRAGKGNGVGSAAGRIDRSNVPAVVDVTIDGGSVSAHGVVRKVDGGVSSLAVGAVVTYSFVNAIGPQPMGVTSTDLFGQYSLTGLPVGPFTIRAQVNSRDSATVSGVAAAGDNIERDVSVEIPPVTSLGYVEGSVVMPDGAAAAGVIVSSGPGSVLSGPDGAFRLPVIPQTSAHSVKATTRDRKRSGETTAIVNQPGQTATGALITLSGLGTAEFTVLDMTGQALNGRTVKLLDSTVDPCGRSTGSTDALGRVRFSDLGLGSVIAQVVNQGEIVDAARASVSVSGEGQTGFGILRVETRAAALSGVVLDPSNQPVQGADVELRSSTFVEDPASFSCAMQTVVTHRARTGVDGRFRFQTIHPGRIYLTASQDPFFPTPTPLTLDLAPGAAPEVTLRLTTTISGEISGTVYEPDGATIAGSGVEVTMNGPLPDVTVATNSLGRFVFPKVFPQGSYTLTARDTTTGLIERTVIYVAPLLDAVHDIRLKGKARVQIRVEDALAQPLASAYVTLKEIAFPSRVFEGVIDASNLGAIEFPGVFEGPVSIEARDPFGRGGRSSLTIPSGADTVAAVVRVTTTGTVRGRFLRPLGDDTPIPYGSLKLLVAGRLIGQVTTSATTPPGGFEFAYVPAGSFRLEALDPLTGRTGIATGTVDTEGQVVEVDVRAQGVGTVSGLLTSNGAPQGGARIELVSGSYAATTVADFQGRYTVQGVPEGHVVASADIGNGFLRGTASGTLQGEGALLTLDVPLRSSGSVRGQVFKAGTTESAGVVGVSLFVGGTGGGSVTGSTDETGAFFFDRVPAGLAQISVDALGSDDFAITSVEVPAAAEVQVTMTLNGIGGLQGQGLDSVGSPTPGRVIIQGGPDQRRYGYSIDLDANGRFELPRILAGPFTVRLLVTNGGLQLYGTASGAVSDSVTTNVSVQLQASATITGRVLRAGGVNPAYGSNVSLQLASGAQTNVQAQTDGRFEFRGATLGAFTLRANDPVTTGAALVTGSTATNGQTVDVGDLILDESPVQVTSVDPTDGATGVLVSQVIHLTFSDPLQGVTGLRIVDGATPIAGATLSSDGLTATFTPPGVTGWPNPKTLAVVADTTVTDVLNRRLVQTFTSYFTTEDHSPPTATAFDPGSGAVQILADAPVLVTFSEDLQTNLNPAGVIRVFQAGIGEVSGITTFLPPRVVKFVPSVPLALNSSFSIVVNGAIDAVGNRQTSQQVTLFSTLDTLPPTLHLSGLVSGGWTTSRRPLVLVTLTDNLSGVDASSATFHLDGADPGSSKSTSAISFTPATDLTEGQHSLDASVQDLRHNTGTLSATFGVDSVAPSPADIISGVSAGGTVAGTITLAASSFDETSGLAKIEILEAGSVRATLLPPTFSLAYNTNAGGTKLAEGSHTFVARAVDGAGNVAALGTPVSFYVDNQILTLAITAPTNGLHIRDTVSAAATTSEPVARVTFAIGATLVEDVSAPYSAALDTSALPEGNQTITVTAYALTGEPTSATVSVFIDRTPPFDPVTGKITADDQGNGLAQVAGLAGAIVGGTTVEVRKVGTTTSIVAVVATDGSFATLVAAAEGTFVELRALDSVGNASQWLQIPVTRSVNADGIPQKDLALWVKADAGVVVDASNQVQSWTDQSGHNNHLVQATSTRRPTLIPNGFNGYPVLRFDGNSDYLNFTTRLSATIRTVFWVVKEDSAAPVGRRNLLGDASLGNDFRGGSTGTIWGSDSGVTLTTSGSTFANGVPVNGTTTTRPKTMSVISLVTISGATASFFGTSFAAGSEVWWGDLAEMIVYERALTDSERKQVEDYLAQKYRPYVPAVGAPRVSPAGGVFAGSTTVTLTSQTPGSALHYTLDGSDPSETSTLYEAPITISSTTTVRARAFKTGLDPSVISTAGFTRTEEAPPSPANLALWVRADAGISTDAVYITSWADQSGRANNLNQTNGIRLPALVQNVANGLPALRFDGNADFLNFTNRVTGIRTVFWVIKEDSAAPVARRTILGDASSGNDFRGGSTGTIWANDSGQTLTVDGSTFLNGVPINGTTTPRPKTLSILSLVTTTGASAGFFGTTFGGEFWWGDLAEMIVYDKELSFSERAQVEGYLTAKYAIGDQVVAPSVSPNGGIFAGQVSVSMTTPTRGAEVHYTLDGTDPTISSFLFSDAVLLSATTTVKARAFKAGLADSPVTTVGFTSDADITPKSVSSTHLKLWWRADAGAAAVAGARLDDQSGNNNHALQPSSRATPVIVQNAANGLPAIRFDGNSDYLTLANRLTTIRTVFWVVKEDAAAPVGRRNLLGDPSAGNDFRGGAGGTIWGADSGQTLTTGGSTFLNGNPTAINGTTTLRPKTMSVISLVTTSNGTASLFGTSFGASGEFWWGDLAELVIYDTVLSTTDRQKIETYLKAKYGIP